MLTLFSAGSWCDTPPAAEQLSMAAVGGASAGAEQAPRIVVEAESAAAAASAPQPEAGFEIVSKQSVDVKDVEKKKEDNTENVEETAKPQTDDEGSQRKKSIVDISVIKENTGVQNEENLEKSIAAMPGMTKSISKEILKVADESGLKEIAASLDTTSSGEAEDGSMIDISVVEEEDAGAGSVLVAELLEDGEEVSLVPGRDEAVVEVTLEMRHAIPLLSALVALAAAIYAFINYTNI